MTQFETEGNATQKWPMQRERPYLMICCWISLLSVLDMARHVPLYQAVLEVLRAVALCPVLLPLLLPRSNGFSLSHQERGSVEPPSIVSLLDKMKQCVDTYSKTLR